MELTTFQIFKQISPETNHSFMIVEINTTTDGPRTRICNGRYDTEEIAMSMMKVKKEYINRINKNNKEL